MRQFEDIDNDCSVDEEERLRRKNKLMKLVKMPPTTQSFRPSSLPSCVTGTLEAMVGPNLDDLTLDDIDSSGLEAITPEVLIATTIILVLSVSRSHCQDRLISLGSHQLLKVLCSPLCHTPVVAHYLILLHWVHCHHSPSLAPNQIQLQYVHCQLIILCIPLLL